MAKIDKKFFTDVSSVTVESTGATNVDLVKVLNSTSGINKLRAISRLRESKKQNEPSDASLAATLNKRIKKLKENHSEQMEVYSQNIKDFLVREGNKPCDYLTHCRTMLSYHRGAYYALVELEKELT